MKLIYIISILIIISAVATTGKKEIEDYSDCGTIRCRYYQNCVKVNGESKCIDVDGYAPYLDPCHDHQCPEKTVCTEFYGTAQCFPSGPIAIDPCDHVICQPHTMCQRTIKGANCTVNPGPPPKDPCEYMRCQSDMKCIVQNGKPMCIQKTDPCSDYKCLGGLVCKNINNVATCVSPIRDPCAGVQCPANTVCFPIGNDRYGCYTNDSYPTCGGQRCGPGTVCANINGEFSCAKFEIFSKPTPNPTTTNGNCGIVPCQQGYVCIFVNGAPQCVKDNGGNVCGNEICRQDEKCILVNGVKTCVAVSSTTGGSTTGPQSCDRVRCEKGFKCILINGVPKCIDDGTSTTGWPTTGSTTGPQTCEKMRCDRGYICVVVNGEPKCIKDNDSNKCGTETCKADEKCVLINGRAQCIVVNGPTTGRPGSCPTNPCLDGYECLIVKGEPTCVPKDKVPYCDGKVCPLGTICANLNGKHECLKISDLIPKPPPPTACKKRCRDGFKCVLVNKEPTCVALSPDDLCGERECKKWEVCAKINGQHICVDKDFRPTEKPTTSGGIYKCSQKCLYGYTCLTLNGVPTCVPPEDKHDPLCGGQLCQDGEICTVYHNQERCKSVKDIPKKHHKH